MVKTSSRLRSFLALGLLAAAAPANAERPGDYVVLRSGATLHLGKAQGPELTLARTGAFRVVRSLPAGGLQLTVDAPRGSVCAGWPNSLDGLGLTLYGAAKDRLSVLKKPLNLTHPDGTSLELAAGGPVELVGNRARAVVATASYLELPAGKVSSGMLEPTLHPVSTVFTKAALSHMLNANPFSDQNTGPRRWTLSAAEPQGTLLGRPFPLVAETLDEVRADADALWLRLPVTCGSAVVKVRRADVTAAATGGGDGIGSGSTSLRLVAAGVPVSGPDGTVYGKTTTKVRTSLSAETDAKKPALRCFNFALLGGRAQPALTACFPAAAVKNP